MKNQYHIGLCKQGNTMIIQACKCIDYLSCEIYDYLGLREITKKQLNINRYEILKMMQNKRPDVYGNLKFAIVE